MIKKFLSKIFSAKSDLVPDLEVPDLEVPDLGVPVAEPRLNFPIDVEAVSGKLRVRIHSHEIETQTGSISCWSYLTQGLREQGQSECLLTLRRTDGQRLEDFSREPLNFFATIHALAERGQIVDVGAITQLSAPDFLGHSGVTYVSARAVADFDLPSPCLAMILLTEEELEAVKILGSARVLGRLGKTFGHYPHPTWHDPERPDLRMTEALDASLLRKTTNFAVAGSGVCLTGERISLRLPPAARQQLQVLKEAPDGAVVAVLPDIDPTADACLVWEPGQSEPTAIMPPGSTGSRPCGCFLALIPGQRQDLGQLAEDGFVMFLTDGSWRAVKNALIDGEDVSVPAGGEGMSLSIEWLGEA